MPKAGKSKIIVREIKSSIKVTEIKKEEAPVELEAEEPSLEDIAETGPSARVFPTFEQREAAQQTPEIETTQTEAAPENRPAIYQVQTNVTEQEIRQKYESPRTGSARERTNIMGIAPATNRGGGFGNTELESARAANRANLEDEKYTVSNEPQQKKETRRYPWEA